tara:strand:+ start:93 stop:878 length:786 start_codon:yes stop_codon:yes gene_type:complete
MSILRSDSIKNRAGTGAPDFPNGATVTGVVTATTFKGGAEITSGTFTGTTGTFSGNVSVGGVLSYEDVTNVDSVGVVTARNGIRVGAGKSIGSDSGNVIYYGDASNLQNLPASGISNLKQAGSSVGTAVTTLNFASGATLTPVRSGISTITIAAGIQTEAITVTTGNIGTLNLGTAQEHKVTSTGITTITCTGGTETDSHVVRIVNSGISTVGFSTYFLWPSGAAPSLPTASGAISLISFTVHRVGAGGTQLLSGASVNYS